MSKVLWLSKFCSTVASGMSHKLRERSMCISHIQCSNYSKTTNDPEDKKCSKKKDIRHNRLQLPSKVHYNVSDGVWRRAVQSQMWKLEQIGKTQVHELLLTLKAHDYTWEEIKRDTEILVLHPSVITERLQLFDEFCIPHPRLQHVARIKFFVATKVSLLREFNIYSKDFDIIDHLLNKTKLEMPEEVVIKIRNRFKDVEDYSLAQIHIYILAHYIAQRFMVDINEVKKIFIQNYCTWKALTVYPRICDIIIHKFEKDFSGVLRQRKFLNIQPDNVLRLLENYPEIGGTPVLEVAKEFPYVLLIPYDYLSRWLELFTSYGVTRFKFTGDTKYILESTNFEEVKHRLHILYKMPEFEILMMSRHFMELLHRPHTFKRIMDVFNSGQAINSMRQLRMDKPRNPLKGYPVQALPSEGKSYIAYKLGIDENKVEDSSIINEVRTNLGHANTRNVLKLLFDFGFTREQIMIGIRILGFEYEILKTTLDEFPMMPELHPFDEWMENPYVVHLLAYFVKRNSPYHW